MRYRRDASGEIVAEEKDEVPLSKEEGLQRWRKEMEMMFLRGDDADFDYKIVDDSEEYDDRGVQEREEEDIWFEQEQPTWAGCEDGEEPKNLSGQTGIQDY